MDWISWSQTWSTKSTTTTSRKTSETKTEAFALKTEVFAFASRSKAKAKPRRPTSACSSTRTVPIRERIWTDVEPGNYSNIAFPVSKRLNTLLRHGQLLREEDGAIEFWRLKDCLRYEFENSQHWSDEMWKSRMAWGGGQEVLCLRALQGHSGRNPIDPSLQDNVLIPDNFFEYIYHIGCAINLHSITMSGSIPGGQNLGKERQTAFFTAVNPMDKEHKDPYEIDLTAPRLAWYKQKKWKRHQDTVYWVDIKQDRTQSSFMTRFQLVVSRRLSWWNLKKLCTRKFMRHLDFLQRFLFKDNWMKELDSEVAGGSKDSQQIQPNSKTPIIKNGETSEWATVHPGDRKRCHVW